MKTLLLRLVCVAVLLGLFPLLSVAKSSGHSSTGTVHVKGYTKKDGTYVAPHDRTAPNHTKNDNWSTKGNVNPETGKAGTKDGDAGTAQSASPGHYTYGQCQALTKSGTRCLHGVSAAGDAFCWQHKK